MKDKLWINRAKWRTGGDLTKKTGKGVTLLLNKENFQCCLGFRCEQMGIPRKQLIGRAYPRWLTKWKIPGLNDSPESERFAEKAIRINDDLFIKIETRERRITKHFLKQNIEVVFYGKYN